MSDPILLDTRTVNYAELMGNGRRFRVPPFQRDYSWSEEQWEDLWNDVLEVRTTSGDRHYMGAVVVQSHSDRESLIIDGQQRIATISILALAVIDRLEALARAGTQPEANRERAKELRNRFVGEKDPASLVEQSRLWLNDADNGFYQDYLVQLHPPLNPRGLSRSNRLLWDCFGYFKSRFALAPAFEGDGEALARLLSETVARQLLFILIRVDDELNAYTVFETLNARGIELTTTDLLKNYLFSRVHVAADLAALQRRWASLMTTVGVERFPEFLRYHLLCEQPKARSQRLFKLVRDRAKTPQEVFALLDALEARAELFAALSDPDHGYWAEPTGEAKRSIRELNLFRVRQMTPLLFAAWEKLSPEDFLRVLRLVAVISFRYSVVSSLNTNELEPAYHQAARALLDGRAQTPRQVFERLHSIYVEDAKFQSDFALLSPGTRGQGAKKLAKYVLARLETDASGRHCDPDADPSTVEHVLPENPLGDWQASIPSEKWEVIVYRLGNLTLLEPPLNREAANKPFAEKLALYRTSQYALTRQIPDLAPEQWTQGLVEARQQRFAGRAVHLWRAEFV